MESRKSNSAFEEPIPNSFQQRPNTPSSFFMGQVFFKHQWVPVPHDKQSEKPIDGWFQYDYGLDLAEGSEKQYTVIL